MHHEPETQSETITDDRNFALSEAALSIRLIDEMLVKVRRAPRVVYDAGAEAATNRGMFIARLDDVLSRVRTEIMASVDLLLDGCDVSDAFFVRLDASFTAAEGMVAAFDAVVGEDTEGDEK